MGKKWNKNMIPTHAYYFCPDPRWCFKASALRNTAIVINAINLARTAPQPIPHRYIRSRRVSTGECLSLLPNARSFLISLGVASAWRFIIPSYSFSLSPMSHYYRIETGGGVHNFRLLCTQWMSLDDYAWRHLAEVKVAWDSKFVTVIPRTVLHQAALCWSCY